MFFNPILEIYNPIHHPKTAPVMRQLLISHSPNEQRPAVNIDIGIWQ